MSIFTTIKNILGLATKENTGDDESSTLDQLDSIRKAHSLLDIRIPRLNSLRCQSMVLSINSREGYLILDEPFPYAALDSGDTLHITARLKNRSPIEFNSKLLAKQRVANHTEYWLELPESIQAEDNFDNYRIHVEKENLSLELTVDNDTVQASIIAMSFDSIKFQILGKYSDQLGENTCINNCFLRFPDGELIDCHITIQKCFDMTRPLPHTLCTAKLELETKTDNKKFDQYLAAIQRQRLRRELRLK